MKVLISVIMSVFVVAGVIDNIATVNRLKKEAEQAYKDGDYATAVAHYQTLVDSLNVQDDNIRLNLAHSLIQAGDTISAQRNYSSLVRSNENQIKSIAYQQMGIITSGGKTNWENNRCYVNGIDEHSAAILSDPQSNGGLLITIDPRYRNEFENVLVEQGLGEFSEPIGEIVPNQDPLLDVIV